VWQRWGLFVKLLWPLVIIITTKKHSYVSLVLLCASISTEVGATHVLIAICLSTRHLCIARKRRELLSVSVICNTAQNNTNKSAATTIRYDYRLFETLHRSFGNQINSSQIALQHLLLFSHRRHHPHSNSHIVVHQAIDLQLPIVPFQWQQ